MNERIKIRLKRWTGIVIAVLGVLSVVGIYQFKRAEDLSLSVENQYTHAFHEMTDYVQDVDVLLKKSMLISDPRQMSAVSAEIYMQTAAAKANLAQLPTSELDLSATSKFLSQAGDYTSYLATKVIHDSQITEAEYENLSRLSDYAEKISDQLQTLDNQLYEQQISFKKMSRGSVFADDGNDFASGMENVENVFQDYPALIYDGPFSEHIENQKPVMLQNKKVISRVEALETAKKFLGDNRKESLKFSGESNGTISTYDFSGKEENDREFFISITKQGGHVLYMLDNRNVTEEKLTIAQAIGRASNFLREHGFGNMKSSYYEKSGQVATINFAAVQDGVVLYTDLVKVKIALDNGEVLGFESKGYLMSHSERAFPATTLGEAEILAKINSHLSVEKVQLAYIPLSSQREVLTYECQGTYKDHNFLIYLNAATGEEEKILMLLESEDGILTV